jgi:hypothetical protein
MSTAIAHERDDRIKRLAARFCAALRRVQVKYAARSDLKRQTPKAIERNWSPSKRLIAKRG